MDLGNEWDVAEGLLNELLCLGCWETLRMVAPVGQVNEAGVLLALKQFTKWALRYWAEATLNSGWWTKTIRTLGENIIIQKKKEEEDLREACGLNMLNFTVPGCGLLKKRQQLLGLLVSLEPKSPYIWFDFVLFLIDFILYIILLIFKLYFIIWFFFCLVPNSRKYQYSFGLWLVTAMRVETCCLPSSRRWPQACLADWFTQESPRQNFLTGNSNTPKEPMVRI